MRGTFVRLAGVASLAVSACPSVKDVPCLDDSSCDLTAGGRCVTATTGSRWCAYPDEACLGGLRFSDFDVGDGLAGVCVPAPVPLTVERAGFGSGSITVSDASGPILECGPLEACTVDVRIGTVVTMTAEPLAADVFYGWSGGGCDGPDSCFVTVDAATTIGATFDQCDRSSIDNCDANTNIYERCEANGQSTMTVACPMYCSATERKCADLDPSDDPVLRPLDALMDVLAESGHNLMFPSSCTAVSCTIDTTTGVINGALSSAAPPSTVVAGSGRVFRVESLTLQGVVKVRGTHPLVILSNDAIVIRGTLDVSADKGTNGPGAQSTSNACAGRFHRASMTVSAGGGGAGRQTAGATGGNSQSGALGATGGAIENEPSLIPLRGGCVGGWVDESGGSRVTSWGGGGGAVQLVSRKSVSILGGGVIDVSGGGGPSGDASYPTEVLGGSGGGSGGSVLIEAPSVVLDGAGVTLSAKGGGGSASGSVGFDGVDGGYAAGAAPGGTRPNGASGGAGGTEITPPGSGQNATGIGSDGQDGGGGGGAVGVCRINTRTGEVTQQNGAAVRCSRPPNTRLAERILP